MDIHEIETPELSRGQLSHGILIHTFRDRFVVGQDVPPSEHIERHKRRLLIAKFFLSRISVHSQIIIPKEQLLQERELAEHRKTEISTGIAFRPQRAEQLTASILTTTHITRQVSRALDRDIWPGYLGTRLKIDSDGLAQRTPGRDDRTYAAAPSEDATLDRHR